MSLLDDLKTPCIRLVRASAPDGEGGTAVAWTAGEQFYAVIAWGGTTEGRRAERDGAISRYTVTTDRRVALRYHDVLQRLSDNKIFRVTSDGDDVQTPARSSFSFAQVTAEEWRLPE